MWFFFLHNSIFDFLQVVRIVRTDDTKEKKGSENDLLQNNEAKGSDDVGSNVINKEWPQNYFEKINYRMVYWTINFSLHPFNPDQCFLRILELFYVLNVSYWLRKRRTSLCWTLCFGIQIKLQ